MLSCEQMPITYTRICLNTWDFVTWKFLFCFFFVFSFVLAVVVSGRGKKTGKICSGASVHLGDFVEGCSRTNYYYIFFLLRFFFASFFFIIFYLFLESFKYTKILIIGKFDSFFIAIFVSF